jgi:hypothetical protein
MGWEVGASSLGRGTSAFTKGCRNINWENSNVDFDQLWIAAYRSAPILVDVVSR